MAMLTWLQDYADAQDEYLETLVHVREVNSRTVEGACIKMNKAFEKILERLNEASERYEDIGFAEIGNNGHTLDFEYAKGKMEGIVEAISIVKEVAEEYNGG